MAENSDAEIRHVYERWHETILGRDLDGLMALYAEDAILETPLILATLKDRTEGILTGKAEIRLFFEAGRFNSRIATVPSRVVRKTRDSVISPAVR